MSESEALTLARMRADVAKLLGEEPEDIGDDDNLMDLGLDSMRVLELTVQWSQAGVPLELSQLAADVTLAGWWSTVQRLQGQVTPRQTTGS